MLPQIKYAKFDAKRRFGIEIEVAPTPFSVKNIGEMVSAVDKNHVVKVSENYDHDINNNHWHVKWDHSCGDIKDQYGWEIASYVASGHKDLKTICSVVHALKEKGVRVNNNCALHVHTDIHDFDVNKASCLVANWMRIEAIVCEAVPKHRRSSIYCKLLTKKLDFDLRKSYNPAVFWSAVRPKANNNTNRRVALNMCNFGADRGTSELRLPESSLDPMDVKNWSRLFVHFIENVKGMPFPAALSPVGVAESLAIMGLHGVSPFIILSSGLWETKRWFLQRLLRFSTKPTITTQAQKMLSSLETPTLVDVVEEELE